MDIAKKSKLYPQLTVIMLRKVFGLFADQTADFSINISSEDITNESVVREIYDNLEKFPRKERVVFELLESEGIQNYGKVIAFIDRIKAMGAKIALDDFGSGYSNFSHILKLNVDYIKIDGSLIKEIHTDSHAPHVVETIINFSKKLDYKTVAEFVHCEEVKNIVTALGIDYLQGYHCGLPSPVIA
jgi:EAL domain-containing protein (putative c-di-GMP-specific phosphodiesterase class I)